MKKIFALIFLVLICALFTCGCTSQSGNQVKTPSSVVNQATTVPATKALLVNETASAVTIALFPQDLPKGFTLLHDYWMDANETCPLDKLCMKEGYSVTIDTGNNSTVEQNVMVYTKPVTNATLEAVLNEGYPEFSSYVINELAPPGLGEMSRLWKYITPKDIGPELHGYFIVFGKGNIYEIFHVSGKAPELETGRRLAAIAAQKLNQ